MRRHNNASNRSTLSAVAQKAGVSVSTASLVLTGKARERRISEDVHARVEAAARELDYSPNLLVRSMQGGSTNVIAFFNTFRYRQSDDLYMDRLSTAIENAAGKRGYDILVHCNFNRGPEETYRAINGGRADGLLMFAPLHDDPLVPLLEGSRLPIVLVNGRRNSLNLSTVKDDMNLGMAIVARKLVEAGHRRIGILCDASGESRDAEGRSTLLRRLLADSGIEVPDTLCLPVRDHDRATTAAAVDQMLANGQPPTAIFCWHDLVGYQALEYCEHAGISVPDRLAVMGYDGMHWPFDTRHRLASVKVDLDDLANASVDLLDELIRNPDQGICHRLIPVEYYPGTTLNV